MKSAFGFCILLIITIDVSFSMNFKLIHGIYEKDIANKLSILHCNEDIIFLARGLIQKLSSISITNIDTTDTSLNVKLNDHNLMMALDLECQRSSEILNVASDLRMFNKKTKWILFGNNLNDSLYHLQNQNINIDANILLIIKNEQNSLYNIYHIQCPALRRNGLMFRSSVGNYTELKHPTNRLNYNNPFNKMNYTLHGTILRISIVVPSIPPNLTFLEYATKLIANKEFSISRSAYQLVLLFADTYNFRIHLIRCGEYGSLRPNSSDYNGLVGLIQHQLVDFGAQSFVFAKSRVSVMDSGFSVIKYKQAFVFCHPKYSTNEKSVFLMPLDSKVWFSILGVSVATILALALLQKIEQTGASDSYMIVSIVNVIGLLAQQGLSFEQLSSLKFRIVLIFFLLLSFILFQFYSASIVGSLLTPAPRTITTHKKLTESNLQIILEEHPSSHIIFKLVTDPDIIRLYENKIKSREIYVRLSEGLSALKNKNNVLLTYFDEVSDQFKASLSAEQMEKLQIIPVFPQDHRALLYMPLVKEGHFNELIRVGNLKLTESGLKKHILDKYDAKLVEKSSKSFDPAVVDIARTAPIFGILIIGIITSLIVLVAEFIVVFYQKK